MSDRLLSKRWDGHNGREVERRAVALAARIDAERAARHAVRNLHAADLDAETLAKYGLTARTLVVRGPAHPDDCPAGCRRALNVACNRCGKQSIRKPSDLKAGCDCGSTS